MNQAVDDATSKAQTIATDNTASVDAQKAGVGLNGDSYNDVADNITAFTTVNDCTVYSNDGGHTFFKTVADAQAGVNVWSGVVLQ